MTTMISVEIQKSSNEQTAKINSNRTDVPNMTRYYQADQQVKYLHLQAEIEVLLQELQNRKQQKQSLEFSLTK